MARPIKNNADYFPHDADMRNDPKIKALRRKFGVEGYGIYTMVIESLTDAEHFQIRTDNLGIELLAGDFDVTPDLLLQVLEYCYTLDLFQCDNFILTCKSLDNRLNPLLSKRKREQTGVIDVDNTQSKVKESKVNKSKEEESKSPTSFDENFEMAFDEITCERYSMTFKGLDLGKELQQFRIKCDNDPQSYHYRDAAGLRTAFQYQLKNSKVKNGKQRTSEITVEDRNAYFDAKYGNPGATKG